MFQIYWTDGSSISYQPWLSAAAWTSNQISNIQTVSGWHINGIAVDWLVGNVYFTESTHGNIISARNSQSGISIYRIVVSGGTEIPTAICADPYRGYVQLLFIGTYLYKAV